MFSQVLRSESLYPFSSGLSTLVLLSIAWLSWYAWRFVFAPALYPREPKEKPYWIPGHGISFFKDSEGTFEESRKYFEDDRKPFAVTVMGQRLYAITSPQDVSNIYRNTTTLGFDEFVRDTMLSLGASHDGVRKMYESPRYGDGKTSGKENGNRLHKILAHAGEDYYREQLLPGDLLDQLWTNIEDRIFLALNWESLPKQCTLFTSQDIKTLSLLPWCRETLVRSVTTAIFGERLLQLEPRLVDVFMNFDDNSWQLTYKLPRRFAKEVHIAKDTIVATFKRYFALPSDQRAGETWLVRTLETEMRKIEVSETDIAALFAMPLWVINGNAYKLAFWMMAYIIHDSSLYKNIRNEIDPAVSKGQAGLESRLEDCQRLVAIYHEILRLNTASVSIRSVDAPTDVGSVTLSAGAKVLLPYRQLHFDESVFGDNAAQFDAERFFTRPDLSKSPSFRPFGGGTTYCSGRHVAKREVLTFVALALYQYDIEVAAKVLDPTHQGFPRCDVKKPCLGVLPPVAADDIKVVLRKRKL